MSIQDFIFTGSRGSRQAFCAHCNKDVGFWYHTHPYYFYDEDPQYLKIDVRCPDCGNQWRTDRTRFDREVDSEMARKEVEKKEKDNVES